MREGPKAKLIILFAALFLVVIAGCNPDRDKGSSKGSAKGTEGITINFLKNNPQNNFIVSDEDEPISIILEIRNKGSYPQEQDQNILSRGQVYVSGFDRNIIRLEESSNRLSRQTLTGVSSINPEGGFDTIEFKGDVSSQDIVIDKYEPTILATLCYPYVTKASPSICIDPFPFDDKQKKVCKVGSQTLSSQGAPLAITKIDQEASSNKIRIKLNLKNVGKGDIILLNALDSCNPLEGDKLEREDFDKVELVRADAGFATLKCEPLEGNNLIKLHNGEGFVICSIDKADYEDTNSAYTTPLNLEFKYGYRTTISKPIKISKLTSRS